MIRQRSCDEHVRYRAGCDVCNEKSARAVKRMRLLLDRGVRLSAPAQLCADRLRALRAHGYGITYLHNRSGVSRKSISCLCDGTTQWVQLSTYQRIDQLWRDLRDYPGPDLRAANWAKKHGWTPPPPLPMPDEIGEDFVDDEVVRRAVAGGYSGPITRAEKVAAWAILEKRGLSADKISQILHTSERSVVRWRGGYVRKPYGRSA